MTWYRLALLLEVAAFFLVTPEFLGETRLKQISALLQRVGKTPFRVADLLTTGRRKPIIAFEDSLFDSFDFRAMWRYAKPLLLILVTPGLVSVASLALLPWPFKWMGVALVGLAALAQFQNWVYPELIFKVGTLPMWAVYAYLVAILPMLSFQSWLYFPSLLVGSVALRLSDVARLRLVFFGLGVGMFLLGKVIEFAH